MWCLNRAGPLVQLMARAYDPASIIAFLAGPCSIAAEDVVDLGSALAGHSLTIVSLAPPAELGKACMADLQRLASSLSAACEGLQQAKCHGNDNGMPAAALQSCVGSLSAALEASEQDSGNSGMPGHAGRGHRLSVCRLVFVDPPEEGLEPWQQLERVLESLEAAPVHGSAEEGLQLADSAACRPASRAGRALSSSNAGLGERAGAAIAPSRAPQQQGRPVTGGCCAMAPWPRPAGEALWGVFVGSVPQ